MKTNKIMAGLALAFSSSAAMAVEIATPAISVVLDGYYQDGDRAMAMREDGFGLGHTELAISSSIDDMFFGKLTTILETHDGDTEVELEEAFIQTLAMPAGFSVRAGRFLSDFGYLNNQHLHSDAFVERPAVYRGFFGGHYFDDGVRLNWVAPTDLYWTLGVEGFSGDALQAEGIVEPDNIGVVHGYSKFGGDIGRSHSWQLGLSYLHNANGRSDMEHDHGAEEGHGHADEEHGHSHGVSFTGETLYGIDAVYKWAPNGNYKNQHLTLSAEYLLLDDLFVTEHHDEHAEEEHDEHGSEAPSDYSGWYASAVYQFNPNWSAGVRYGELDAALVHEEEHEGEHQLHFEQGKLKETELMLAWHHSHFSTVRLQYSHIDDGLFESKDDNVITLQFIMTLGAHGAHQF
ncbi:membrane protein [Ferrimonas senticii]|uniref:membrane protein n=1 Tax=Ferrimonas senticii TaxID=394566 RepID=UPI00040B4959